MLGRASAAASAPLRSETWKLATEYSSGSKFVQLGVIDNDVPAFQVGLADCTDGLSGLVGMVCSRGVNATAGYTPSKACRMLAYRMQL